MRIRSGSVIRDMSRKLGLPDGELITHRWPGKFDLDVSMTTRLAVGAAGALAGALFGQVVVLTIEAYQFTVLFTNQRRLVLVCEGPNDTYRRIIFELPTEVAITPLGPGRSPVHGQRSEIIEFAASDGIPLRAKLPRSITPYLQAWTAGAALPS